MRGEKNSCSTNVFLAYVLGRGGASFYFWNDAHAYLQPKKKYSFFILAPERLFLEGENAPPFKDATAFNCR